MEDERIKLILDTANALERNAGVLKQIALYFNFLSLEKGTWPRILEGLKKVHKAQGVLIDRLSRHTSKGMH